ncbi:MAG: aminodeoxychorismate/anthranilate synthase component II [Bacteroidetes bacterium]|nr:MAG: aminodeoxychorismate/anthranilate synthase component II [Bacteroidota bacterium]
MVKLKIFGLKLAIIDFHDSFTFNISYQFLSLGLENEVFDFELVKLEDLEHFDAILLSPGPGLPSEKPIINSVLNRFARRKPIIGICLGMQAITLWLGGEIYNLNEVRHGKSEYLTINDPGHLLVKDIVDKSNIGLYHSWACNVEKSDIKAIATDSGSIPMIIASDEKKMVGIQFHPESIMTDHSQSYFVNFIEWIKEKKQP